jgi:hypothetical protein
MIHEHRHEGVVRRPGDATGEKSGVKVTWTERRRAHVTATERVGTEHSPLRV